MEHTHLALICTPAAGGGGRISIKVKAENPHLSGKQQDGAQKEADGAASKADAGDNVVDVQGLSGVEGGEPVQLNASHAVTHCTNRALS